MGLSWARALCGVLALTACGEADGDGGSPLDAAPVLDARPVDAGTDKDARPAEDAALEPVDGPPDSGPDAAATDCRRWVRVGELEIFAFEASRPEAGDGPPCSVAGAAAWTDLTVGDARAACASADARLCSGPEWQRACDGGAGRLFPYGSVHQRARCNDHVSGSGALEPTGSRPECATPEGVFDLSGNVWELVSEGEKRGASWRVNATMFHTDSARCDVAFVVIDSYQDSDVGFRCCRDPG
jgi:hypothetical protein